MYKVVCTLGRHVAIPADNKNRGKRFSHHKQLRPINASRASPIHINANPWHGKPSTKTPSQGMEKPSMASKCNNNKTRNRSPTKVTSYNIKIPKHLKCNVRDG